MRTIHIYRGSRWQRWYNQPGSFGVARRYGQLSRSAFWDTIFPGPDVEPSSLFSFRTEGRGPNYFVTHGTSYPDLEATSYVARCFFDHYKATQPHPVAIVKLPLPNTPYATLSQNTSMKILAAVPVLTSIATAAGSALIEDWYCCSMIVFGMACNGIACCVAGRRDLRFEQRPPTSHPLSMPRAILSYSSQSRVLWRRPTPMGILYDGNDLVVMQGPDFMMNAIAYGKLGLTYLDERPYYHDLGVCAVLLSSQLLAQLLIVPQGKLIGQLLFLVSLAVSWVYNSYISSSDITMLFKALVFENLFGLEEISKTPPQQGPYCETRTSAVVFALLVMAPSLDKNTLPLVLDRLLHDNTRVWKMWKDSVVKCIEQHWNSYIEQLWDDDINHHIQKLVDSPGLGPRFTFNFPEADQPLSAEEISELNRLRSHAREAAEMYRKYQT